MKLQITAIILCALAPITANAATNDEPRPNVRTITALTARLQPVANKKAGEKTDFEGPYLFNTTLHQAH